MVYSLVFNGVISPARFTMNCQAIPTSNCRYIFYLLESSDCLSGSRSNVEINPQEICVLPGGVSPTRMLRTPALVRLKPHGARENPRQAEA